MITSTNALATAKEIRRRKRRRRELRNRKKAEETKYTATESTAIAQETGSRLITPIT
jgi:hypothetical protein